MAVDLLPLLALLSNPGSPISPLIQLSELIIEVYGISNAYISRVVGDV